MDARSWYRVLLLRSLIVLDGMVAAYTICWLLPIQLGLYSLCDQFMRTEEHSFSSEHKWMGVRARMRTQRPTDVSQQRSYHNSEPKYH